MARSELPSNQEEGNTPNYPEREFVASKIYVPKPVSREVLLKGPEVKIDFSEGTNYFGNPFDHDPPEVINAILKLGWEEGFHYPNENRILQLQTNLKERAGFSDGEAFIFGAGSDRGLSDIIARDLPDDALVIGIGPHFTGAQNLAVKRGDPELYKAIEPPSFSIKEGLAMLKKDSNFLRGGAMIYASPGTPTGEVFSADEIQDLIERSQFHKNIVLLDMAYGRNLTPEETGLAFIDTYENLIILDTFSKDLGLPGYGIGIGYFSKGRAEKFSNILLPYPLRGPSLIVAEEVLLTDRLDTFLARNGPKVTAANTELMHMLDDEGIPYVHGKDPRTLPIAIGGINDNFQKDLLHDFGIKTAGAEGFDPTHHGLSNSWVRVIVHDTDHNTQLVQAAAAIRDRYLEPHAGLKIRVLTREIPLRIQVEEEDNPNAPENV